MSIFLESRKGMIFPVGSQGKGRWLAISGELETVYNHAVSIIDSSRFRIVLC